MAKTQTQNHIRLRSVATLYTSSENHKIKFGKLEYLLQESYFDVKWDSCLKIVTPNLKHRSIPQTQLYLHTLITYKSCYIQTTTPLEISIFSIAQNTTRNRKQNTFRRHSILILNMHKMGKRKWDLRSILNWSFGES